MISKLVRTMRFCSGKHSTGTLLVKRLECQLILKVFGTKTKEQNRITKIN